MKKFYYVYMIICTEGSLKNHYYIGQRSTNIFPEKDKYKGSGKIIRDYYKKYPKAYKKQILCICNSVEELNKMEKYYIEKLYGPLCLNLAKGGNGGDTIAHMTEEELKEFGKKVSIGLNSRTEEQKRIASEHQSQAGYERWNKMNEEERQHFSDVIKQNYIDHPELKEKVSHPGETNGMYGKRGKDSPNYGKRRTEETRRKQRESALGKNTWSAHTRYIYLNNVNKRVKESELDYYLSQGWQEGMITKRSKLCSILNNKNIK